MTRPSRPRARSPFRRGAGAPPPWRDVRVLRIVFQVVFLALVIWLIYYLYRNLITNLTWQGITTDFDFLEQTAGFAITNSDFDPTGTYLGAILVGVVNTAYVAVAGIVLATVIGVIVGVARLSTNWLVRRAAAVYVELFRNIPVLVIIIFWYLAVLTRLPPIDRAIDWGGVLLLSNRGLILPWAGLEFSPEYGALLVGLTVYTASHIAEIVRGSILAVPRGQAEAADAIALSPFQRLRFVVLPQALRIMVPPVANQYLNLTKNSSLGVAIAFPEVTRVVRIAIGQQAPAPQAIAILMLVYLVFSLTTSLITNWFNRRIALKGGA